MSDEILIGKKHRYHIVSLIESNSTAYTYRAFARWRTAKGLIARRYYAIVTPAHNESPETFHSSLLASLSGIPFPVRIEEEIHNDFGHYYVISKGKAQKKDNPLSKLFNKGYLMLALAALILILLIVKHFS